MVLDVEDDDGLIGVVVSDRFRQVESIDRQTLIQEALSTSQAPLTMDEMRRVLAIIPMTPEEYVAYGPSKKAQRKVR